MQGFSCLALSFFLLGTCFTGYAQKSKKDDRPNIVFLLSDDQRYDTMGFMGNPDAKTPNLDKLAEEGVYFTNHYANTSICMGSRATILTGLYEHNSGCNFQHGPLSVEKFQKTYPMLLKKAGYFTGFAGKFGFAVKDDPNGNSSYHEMSDLPADDFDWWAGWPGQGYYQTAKNVNMLKYVDEHPHVSTALGAAGADFIQQAKDRQEPFCLSISFKAPHSPSSPDPRFDDVYAGAKFPKPENFGREGGEHLPQQPKMGRQYKRLGEKWTKDYNKALAVYYQLIYGVDQAVGIIMAELEKEGLMENTIVIYTTDNGYSTGAHGFGGKVLPYEEGARGPLIVAGPDKYIKGGRKSEALTGTIDMMPTILEYAGVQAEGPVDGVSLVPVLKGKKKSVKDHQMVLQLWGDEPTQALTIVSEGFKYLYWFYGGQGMEAKEELYDIRSDKYEMTNLSQNEAYKGTLTQMREIYDDEVARWGDNLVAEHGYEKYETLFNRYISWEEKSSLMPVKVPKPPKSKEQKEAEKKAKLEKQAKRKAENAAKERNQKKN